MKALVTKFKNYIDRKKEEIERGKVKNCNWQDVEAIKTKNDIILLDVRTTQEYQGGNVKGFINIPLDALKDRLNELDKTKKIYIMCQSGVRSHMAAKMLLKSGFETYNIKGGYKAYSSNFS